MRNQTLETKTMEISEADSLVLWRALQMYQNGILAIAQWLIKMMLIGLIGFLLRLFTNLVILQALLMRVSQLKAFMKE